MKTQPTAPQSASRPRSQLNLVLLVALALLLIAASVILILTLPHAQAPAAGAQASETAPAQLAGFSVDAAEAQQMHPLGSAVVRVSPSRITALDLNGGELFAEDIQMAAPAVIVQGDRMLVADREGYSYVLLSPGGVRQRGSTASVLRGGALAPDGHFALVTEPADSTGVVSIHEPARGQKLYDCLFPDSGFVLSVAFTPDSKAFDVSLLNTDGATVHPILKRFTIAGEATGQRELDDTEILPLIVYDADMQPVLCGSTSLIALSYRQDAPLYRYAFPAVRSVAPSSNGLAVLASDSVGGRLKLTLCPPGGKAGKTIEIGDEATGLVANGTLAMVAGGTRIQFIDLAAGRTIAEQNLAAEIIRVAFGEKQTVTVVTRTGVRQLAIPRE